MSGELEMQPKGEVFFLILRKKRQHSIFYKKLTRKGGMKRFGKRNGEEILFMQELNGFLIDKSEITSLIVGGDWNCTLAKKDKTGFLEIQQCSS